MFFGCAARGRVIVVTEAVVAVEPGGGYVGAVERLFGAGENWDVGIAELGRVDGVAGGLVDADVASDGGDGDDANLWRAEGHDERDGVIGGGVSVDEELARHAGRIANRGLLFGELFGDVHFYFFAGDVEDVNVMTFDGDLRNFGFGKIGRVAIGVAGFEDVFDEIDHVFGFDGVAHGVFFAEEFGGDAGFGGDVDFGGLPVARVGEGSGCD